MKTKVLLSCGICLLLGALAIQAQSYSFNMSALTTFGNNGWLAPNGQDGSTYTYLTTGNTERGLAYGDGDLFLVSRNGGNNVRILNPLSGADLGSLNISGVSGGTFAVNMVTVGGDGTVYVGNLTTSATSPFNLYAWTPGNFSSAPTLVYSANPLGGGTRLGDDLASIGSGASTTLVGGYGAGSSGYQVISIPSIGVNSGTATGVSFTGTPPNAGDFRLGITFTDSSHVLGSQGSSLYRYSSFSGASGTLLGSPNFPDPAGATADRLMAYTVLDGIPLLAVQSTGDSHVSIYDETDPNNPVYLGAGDNTISPTANPNATGELAWGATTYNADGTVSEDLYAMGSNQGIQAFIVTVPEPATAGMMLLGIGVFAFWRKARR